MSLATLTSKRAGDHPHQFRARNLAPGVAPAPDHLKEARDSTRQHFVVAETTKAGISRP